MFIKEVYWWYSRTSKHTVPRRNCSKCRSFQKSITAEREALRMGIERLTGLFPTKVSLFDFKVFNSGRTVQYKLDAQSLQLFGLHSET